MNLYCPFIYNGGYPTSDARIIPLPYGPYTCKQGYVWREAVPGDFVCVSPQTRDETAAENVAGPSRQQPGGGAYGPDTCKQGFVWRETRPSDHVCVPPPRRERARVDNEIAPYTMAYPPAAPNNGVQVWDEFGNREVRLKVRGSFSPNKQVAFYVYDEQHWPNLSLIRKMPTDANGNLPSDLYNPGVTTFHMFVCSNPYQARNADIIVVDEGSGIVSNAGRTVAPWCAI